MKKAVIISALIASIVGGTFTMKQPIDYMLSSVVYAAGDYAYNVSADYKNGILTISGLDGNAIVIKATYNTGGILTDVHLYDAKNGENKINASAGDRLYIWASLSGMRPLWIKIIITEENEAKPVTDSEMPVVGPGKTADGKSEYTDKDGVTVIIPDKFRVSEKEDEQTVKTGLVVIGQDGNEFVWIPTTVTALSVRDFGSYFYGGNISGYSDETDLPAYQEMIKSIEKYGGFYIGRYEASRGKGADGNDEPRSCPVTQSNNGYIWVQYSPQDATTACAKLYADNPSVTGFFPWGCNWDTVLQWLIDSGSKSRTEVVSNSTSWGNYSDDDFSPNANGRYTGIYEQAKANNIYDLAGNNWEWTQERNGSNYVMRGGGYNLMGGACPGNRYPAALRDPLPGNNHHPNVCFRIGLFIN